MLRLLSLLACAGPSPEEDLLTRFDAAPDAVAAELLAEPAGPERDAKLMRLFDERPGRTAALCPGLADGPLKSRCTAVNSRPHLHTPATNEPPEERPRRGERELIPVALLSRWEHASVSEVEGCALDDHACVSEAALAMAQEGRWGDAGIRCEVISTQRWRQECFFRAAEALDAARLEGALNLCLGAGSYAPQCVGHVFLGQLGPEGAPEPSQAEAIATQVAKALRGAPGATELWWCVYAHRLAEVDPAILVKALTALPTEARRHARSALAMAALGAEAPEQAYRQALAGGPPPPALRVSEDRSTEGLTWHRDYPGEQDIPAIPFLHNGADRRAWSEDAAVDAELAWLSAQGHAEAPDLEALVAGLGAEDPLVRWTAARVLVRLNPEHPALAQAALDPDPRVRGRSKPGFAPNPSKRRAGDGQ